MSPEPDRAKQTEGSPPFLGTWPRVYAAVLGWLALLIALLYLFARAFTS